jgi:flagellin
MGEIGNNLQRIRELAVQSRNATNSDSDRAALNQDAQQLKDEINRVASQTSFNGVKLLDGSFEDQVFQVGANQGETITVSGIVDASSDALGTYQSVEYTGGAPTAGAVAAGDLLINGVDIGDVVAGADAAEQGANVAAAINAKSAETGVTAAADAGTGAITLASANGDDIVVAGADAATGSGLAAATYTTTSNGVDNTGFATLDISTAEGADAAMLSMDAALTAINTARADMGAVQNRFSSVVANLSSNVENLSAARSRIQDTDFAAETAALTRNQILQQAGTAMLAQANQAPQGVLSLLR